MARVCIGCKKPIPPTEDSWRDMQKRYACKRCFVQSQPVVRVEVKHEAEA